MKPDLILITVTPEVNRLIEAHSLTGSIDQSTTTRLPDGSYQFPISSDLRERLDSLKFPGESDSDVLLRLLITSKGKLN